MILMAGQKIAAGEAHSWGLIDRIVEGDTLMTAALDLADHARSQSPDHVAAMKAMVPV